VVLPFDAAVAILRCSNSAIEDESSSQGFLKAACACRAVKPIRFNLHKLAAG
jgi:hypothetical protein